jgi:hypothetical protein
MNTIKFEYENVTFDVNYEADDGRVILLGMYPEGYDDDFMPMMNDKVRSMAYAECDRDDMQRQVDAAEAAIERAIDIALDNRERAQAVRDLA